MARSIAGEWIRFGNVDCDDASLEGLLRLRDLVQEAINGLSVHLADLRD
jgi:hypothetical protein